MDPHNHGDTTNSFSRARYVRVNVPTLTLAEDVSIGANDCWYYYPAITANADNHMVMTFNRSCSDQAGSADVNDGAVAPEFAGMRYVDRPDGGPLGVPSGEVKAEEANYVKTFGGTRNRWGDYTGIAVDPSDPTTVWMFAEYAESPKDVWGTWFGKVGPAAQATVTVTKTADTDGTCTASDCSLREALKTVDAGGTIDFAVTGTITLTNGELVIDKDVTIDGPGAGNLAISGNNVTRVLFVDQGNTVEISNLSVTNGNSASDGSGGAIRNRGNLMLMHVTIADNSDGGISNEAQGHLTMSNSTVTGSTSNRGGGILNHRSGSRLTVIDSTISNNSTNSEGGGILNTAGNTAELTNTTLQNNSSNDFGGGIFNSGVITITDSTIRENTANTNGGGIFNTGGTSTVSDSTISGNSSFRGGGIWNDDWATLNITRSTVSNNTASGDGGGIFGKSQGIITLTNSTVSGNASTTGGGGIDNSGSLTIVNTTITGNVAPGSLGGGGIYNNVPITLVNTILAGNTGSPGPDCGGPESPTSLGHNLIGDDSGCGYIPAAGDLVNTDPLMGPLQDNGGPTETHALDPNSPAIIGGDDSAAPLTDQRGVPRPQGAASDIGAYERGPDCAGRASTIVGTNAGETIFGTPGADVIVAKAGNDTVRALGGSDIVCAGAGNDLVLGGGGKDRLYGEGGRDILKGQGGNDKLIGQGGPDRLIGGGGKDVLNGGGGNDKLFGNKGDDRLLGKAGDDALDCGPGTDTAKGGPGTDTATANCESVLGVP